MDRSPPVWTISVKRFYPRSNNFAPSRARRWTRGKHFRRLWHHVNSEDQLELSWLQHSPLICLLQEVAIQKVRDDGWTYLADAGRIARLQVSEEVTDMTAKYGYSTLKRVLVASELFDVFDEPLPIGGFRTLYRTKQSR